MKINDPVTKYVATPRLKERLRNSSYSTLQEFAKACGVKAATISRFDKQTRYDINTLVSVMRVLNVSIDELFEVIENDKYNE